MPFSRALLLAGLVAFFGACANGRNRENPYDPSGRNYAAPGLSLSLQDNGDVFTTNGQRMLSLSWKGENASNVLAWKVFYSTVDSLPSTPFTNVTKSVTSFQFGAVSNSPMDHYGWLWWSNAAETGLIRAVCNVPVPRRGWFVGSGSFSTAILCRNVPLGESRTVHFTLPAGADVLPPASTGSYYLFSKGFEYPGYTFFTYSLVITNLHGAVWSAGDGITSDTSWTYRTLSFSSASGGLSNVLYVTLSVTNVNDTNGINQIGFDELNVVGNSGSRYFNFEGVSISGNLEQ